MIQSMNKIEEQIIDELIQKALFIAYYQKSKYLLLEHLLLVILHNEYIKSIFPADTYEKTIDEVEKFLNDEKIERMDSDEPYQLKISKIIHTYLSCVKNSNLAIQKVLKKNKNLYWFIFLTSVLFVPDTVSYIILNQNGYTKDYADQIFQQEIGDELLEDNIKPIIENTLKKENNSEVLMKYTININDIVLSKKWIPTIGRNSEIELLKQVLLRKNKPNAILVGNHGVGKTKIVEGLAYSLLQENPNLQFLKLDIISLLSNIMLKGEIETRIKSICQELSSNKNIILFIDDIHMICNSPDNSSDISYNLKPFLQDGNIKIIGTTTYEDYRKYLEKDGSLIQKFYKIDINEPTEQETLNILNNIYKSYEKFFNVKFTKKNLELIVQMSKKHFFNRFFPEKSIDLLDMVGSYVKYKKQTKCTEQDIFEVISSFLNVPINSISTTEEEIYKNLENNLKKEIIGQDEAIQKISDAVIISRSGLRETSKTAISLLFKGSTGVGKTEICKVLSKLLNIPLIRFDMSEYMEEHSVSKLIGAPPGYKDAGNGKAGNGLLINAIDENPYCILLLDEIEKAHPKILNLLLQVMDNGKLTSSMGKPVSFENVFVIMTSNIGACNSNKISIGFLSNDDNSQSEKDYESGFLPEFRNRLDATVTFNKLSNEVLKKICIKFLEELKQILKNKKFDLVYNNDIIDYIINKLPSNDNGARPIKHIITNEIKNKIAKNIVFGQYKEKSKIKLTIKNNIINVGV